MTLVQLRSVVAFCARFDQQLIPVIRWISTFQHLAENPVRVIALFVRALGVLIVDPRKYDHLAWCVVAKKKTVLLKELGAEPVLMLVAQSVALTVLCPCRVLRNDLKRQLGDRCQPLAGASLLISDRAFLLLGLASCERVNLGEK